MNSRTLVLAAALAAFPAFAQVQISIQLPTITFAAPPPLVVVQPGVQVVEDNDEEVYFVDNVYWVHRGPHWYRARDHRGGWVLAEGPNVPASIVRLPPGQYRRYKPGREVREEGREFKKEKHHGKH